MTMRLYSFFAKDKENTDNVIVVKFNNGIQTAVYDLYCINPDCGCSDVMLDFIEINDDGKLKDRLFYMHLNTVNWKVGKMSIHVENVDCDKLSGEFLSGLDNEIKSKYRNRAAEAKEYGKENPFEWFDDLDLEDGSCFGFSEVYGEKDTDRFTFECKGITYFVDDQYCTNPECKCNEVVLTFFEVVPSMKTQEPNFAIRMPFNTGNYKVEFNSNTNKAEMDAIIKCFKKHIDNDFELLKARYMKMREFGKKRIERKRIKQMEQKAISTKVGRNDPCLCGSGKKYKKCCGS